MQLDPIKEQYSYNRLIIIGNGFDLANGIPSSFNDFILWYIKKAVKSSFEQKKGYIDNAIWIRKNENYGISSEKLSQLLEINNYNEFIKHLGLLKIELLGKNNFLKRILNNVENHGWVDIERIYFECITKIRIQDTNENIENYNKSLDELKSNFVEYLILVTKGFNHSYASSKLNPLIEQFFVPLEETESKYIHPISTDKPNNVLILNFNYTRTVHLLTQWFYQSIGHDIIHIHGVLNDLDSVIFGYGDDTSEEYLRLENLNNDKFIEKFKSHSYPNADGYNRLLKFIESDKFEVFTVGHSLGLSDKNLLNKIFESDNCLGIKIYWFGENEKNNDHFSKRLAASRVFNDKSKLPGKILPIQNSAFIPQQK